MLTNGTHRGLACRGGDGDWGQRIGIKRKPQGKVDGRRAGKGADFFAIFADAIAERHRVSVDFGNAGDNHRVTSENAGLYEADREQMGDISEWYKEIKFGFGRRKSLLGSVKHRNISKNKSVPLHPACARETDPRNHWDTAPHNNVGNGNAVSVEIVIIGYEGKGQQRFTGED